MPVTAEEAAQSAQLNEEKWSSVEYRRLLKEVKKDPDSYDIWVAHGSNSGSLPGFVAEKGLVPIGWILGGRSKAVPFSGELQRGITERGINLRAISFSMPDRHRQVLEYAHDYSHAIHYSGHEKKLGWNPEKSEEWITINKRALDDPEANNPIFKHMNPQYQNIIQLEGMRQKAWQELSSYERELVGDPFPIVYGINHQFIRELSPKFSVWGSEVPELLIEDRVDSSRLTVFCPEDKREAVKKYFGSKSLDAVRILPLEVYAFLVELYFHLHTPNQWNDRSIEQFQTRFSNPHEFIQALKRHEVNLPFLQEE